VRRSSYLLPFLALSLACGSLDSQESSVVDVDARVIENVRLGEELHVVRTTRVQPGVYVRPLEGSESIVLIDGVQDVELLLEDVTVSGLDPAQPTGPGAHEGVAVLIRNCQNVIVRGGRFEGYRVGIRVEGSRGVTLEGQTFDDWRRQRLMATVTDHDQADTLDYEQAGWEERYGAAISINSSEQVVVRGASGRHGQNGVLLVDSVGCQVLDCDFSFLSGWGVGLWNSRNNSLAHNVLDFSVRGYSHDVYAEGDNSAGLLLSHHSSDNLIVRNSATHCGHGALVFGGSDLFEGAPLEGVGGSDRNVFLGNDFRLAVKSGLELACSDGTRVLENLFSEARGSGVSARFCADTVIAGNEFESVAGDAITIAHGQRFVIAENRIAGSQHGVKLYRSEEERYLEGEFAQHRATGSASHWIIRNELANNDQDFVLKDTVGVGVSGNLYRSVATNLYIENISVDGAPWMEREDARALLEGREGGLPSGNISRTVLLTDAREGEQLLAAAREDLPVPTPGSQRAFLHMGRGIEHLNSIMIGEYGPWDFRSGEPRPALRYPGGELAHGEWEAVWFSWDHESDPRGDLGAWRARRFEHAVRKTVSTFRTPWADAEVRQLVGRRAFGLIATTRLELPPGRYRLQMKFDDGLRVTLDGEPLLEAWRWRAHAGEESVEFDLTAGPHDLALEYFQIEGMAALVLDLDRID